MDNSNQDQKHKKMVIKFGGGGGVGAVILLGGVLAAASAFAARRKGRSSGKDRRSFHRSPPPENDEASNEAVSHVSTESLELGVEMINGVSDDGFIIVDGKLPVEYDQNKIREDEQREGDASDDSLKEMENQERLYGEEVPKQEENTEIFEVEDKGVDEERESGLKGDVEVKLGREEVEGFCRGDEGMMSEKRCVEIEERESGLTEDMEVKLEGEEVGVLGSGDEEMMSEKKCLDHEEREIGLIEEDQETCNVEKLVEKQDKCEEKQGNDEENGYMLHPTLDEITNEEAEFDAKENVEKEVEDLKTSEEEEEEIVGESSLGSGDSSSESNSEAVWPAESAKSKLVDYKISERDDQTVIEEKTFINKYYSMEMEMEKDHQTNTGRRRVAIATFSLLSSLSCSWFLGLSFAKLCLVVFLAMVLSELHGY